MMPTIEYFVWRDQIKGARKMGWTIQERHFNNFFRGYKNAYFHAYAQSMHPFGYNERQRGDNFIRRMETLIPGIEAPAWAYNQKRTPDFDFASVLNVFEAYQTMHSEATPKPHYNSSDWYNICHIFNQRFQGGYYAQRLFFNEEIRGDRYHIGPFGEVDKNLQSSWYADVNNSYLWKMQNYGEEEAKMVQENAKRWIGILDKHYPEFKDVDSTSVSHKFNEPHYERNVSDIRRTILSERWVEAIQSNKFSAEEIDEIKTFMYTENVNSFFHMDAESGSMETTALYKKFVSVLGLPCVMEINRFTGTIPEHQYINKMEVNYGINFYSVNSYRKNLVSMTNTDDFRKLSTTVKGFSLRTLVAEEIYKPLFRRSVANSANGNPSGVIELLKENPANLQNLIQQYHASREELGLFDQENFNRYLAKVRSVVSTFRFVPKN